MKEAMLLIRADRLYADLQAAQATVAATSGGAGKRRHALNKAARGQAYRLQVRLDSALDELEALQGTAETR